MSKCAQFASLTLLTYITVGEVSSVAVQPCGPFIKYPNGSDTIHTIGSYLENSTQPPCSNMVNSGLSSMFKNGISGSLLRKGVEKNLGNVCAIFIEVVSIIANRDLGVEICREDSFADEKITGSDFCSIRPDSEAVAAMHSILDFIGFGNFSQELTNLLNLKECAMKCGEGTSGQIMCNAFYSVMQLFSKVFPPHNKTSQSSGKINVMVMKLATVAVAGRK